MRSRTAITLDSILLIVGIIATIGAVIFVTVLWPSGGIAFVILFIFFGIGLILLYRVISDLATMTTRIAGRATPKIDLDTIFLMVARIAILVTLILPIVLAILCRRCLS